MATWSYDERAHHHVQSATSFLDLGTGGGERLSRLGPFRSLGVATEGYRPNVPLAAQRLQPLPVPLLVRSLCRSLCRSPEPQPPPTMVQYSHQQ